MEIGKFNKLETSRFSKSGAYLKDSENNEVLLPNKYVSKSLEAGNILNVFVYKDSEDRPVATTLKPKAIVDEFAYLQVKEVTKIGVFLDWGLEKDLFVPFREQSKKMEKGKWYFVFVYFDYETERIVAAEKINQFIRKKFIDINEDEEVDLLICHKTDLGINVIINNLYNGLIFKNEIFQSIKPGDKIKGYIKTIRADNKIDVSLEKAGYSNIEPKAKHILSQLKFEGGFLPLNDKSDPQFIIEKLEMSKKAFKKAIGFLYKQKMLRIETDGIYLVE